MSEQIFVNFCNLYFNISDVTSALNLIQNKFEFFKTLKRKNLNFSVINWGNNFSVHMGQFLESIGDKIPSFAGIKFTSNNLEEGAQAMHADNKKYVVFLGNDQVPFAIYFFFFYEQWKN